MGAENYLNLHHLQNLKDFLPRPKKNQPMAYFEFVLFFCVFYIMKITGFVQSFKLKDIISRNIEKSNKKCFTKWGHQNLSVSRRYFSVGSTCRWKWSFCMDSQYQINCHLTHYSFTASINIWIRMKLDKLPLPRLPNKYNFHLDQHASNY